MLRIFRLGLFSLAVTAIVFLFYAPAASAAAPPAAPTISSISPASGILAQTVNVILQGTNFVQGNTAVNVSGTGVTSSAVQVVTDTFLFVTLTIAPTTTTGPRDVTVTTSGGTSNASVFTVNDTTLPTITSITPPNGNRGQTVNITVTGTNFVSNATFINVGGNGIGVTAVNVSSVTSLTATLLISTGASTGNRGVSVTTAGGTSSLANFSVLGAPTLTGGCYNLMAGSAVNCTLSGTNFVHGATTVSVSGTGVIVNSVTNSTSTTSRTINVTVAPNADPGSRSFTVSTPGGTSAPLASYVTPLEDNVISTIAGKIAIAEGGVATTQPLPEIKDVARDASGNLYIVPTGANKIYKRTAAGALSTFAGTGIWGLAGDGGPAINAQLARTASVAVDSANNVYIAEDNDIRKVAVDGTISTFAGRGAQFDYGNAITAAFGGDGGPAAYALLSSPTALSFDTAGNLYVIDSGNNRVRKITPSGIISTVAGNGTFGFSGDGGPATDAQLSLSSNAAKVAIDGAGNLYVPDTGNHRIRMITPGGIISTIAGTGTRGFGGDDGPAFSATLDRPVAIALDGSGNLFVSDNNNYRIRKIGTDVNRTITTVAGTGNYVFNGDGPDAKSLNVSPRGLATDPAGNLYFVDQNCNRIRMLAPTGEISTIAGNGGVFSGDLGPATAAQLYHPLGLAVDSDGNILIADGGNFRIRSIDHSTGNITTIAGSGNSAVSGDNGPATSAGLGLALDVAAGAGGVVYVAASDLYLGGTDSRIRKIAAGGTITTIAGGSTSGFGGDDGPAASAILNGPQGIAVDTAGNIYIADTGNNRVRRINASDANIVTVAGNGTEGFSGDGGPATSAQLNGPTHLAVDPAGNLYITDDGNGAIRKVAPDGTISTFTSFSTGVSAGGVAVGNGKVFVASEAQVIRMFDTGGSALLAGRPYNYNGISGDNGSATIASVQVSALAVTASGSVIFADENDYVIRQIAPHAPSSGQLSAWPANLFWRGGGFGTNTTTLNLYTGGYFPWTATASVATPGGGNWLSISPSAGTGATTVNVTVDLTGLTPGDYNGSITFTSADAINGSFTVPVTLTVTPTVISANPASIMMFAPGGFTGAPTLSIYNGGVGSSLTISASSSVITPPGGSWLSLPTSSLTVGNMNSPGYLTPSINATGLANGTYTGTITLTTAGAANSPSTIPVTLNVAANTAAPGLNSISLINGSQGQTVVVTLSGYNFVNGDTTVTVSGTGVTVTSVTPVTATSQLQATLVIDPGATPGTRTISATTSAGTTGTQQFTVLGPPTLTSISPNAAGPGRTVSIVLTGTNFAQTATAVGVSGSGVTVVSIQSSTSTTSRTVTLEIAADATHGPRNLTVSTPAGTTAVLPFTVTPSLGYMISTAAGRTVAIEGGTATAQPLQPPTDVAFDSLGNLYVVVTNAHKVFKITPAGVLTTFAGTGLPGPAGDSGLAAFAQLNSPRSVIVDAGNNVLIADAGNNRIRKVAPDGTITTFAGTGTNSFSGDGGPAAFATLRTPSGLGIDTAGNVYIADAGNFRIRKVDTTGIITTVAGDGTSGFFGDGLPAVLAKLNLDTSQSLKLAIDTAGNLYIPDSYNNRIRKVAANGIITTVAGTGTAGSSGDGGPAAAAQLNSPRAVLIDSGGNLIISDSNNYRVRKVVNGTITTIAGYASCCGFNGDGSPATNYQINPVGLAMDSSGNLLIADQGSNRVRKLSTAGAISTAAGSGSVFTGDGGPATDAEINNPASVAFDPGGNLVIADSRNYQIRKVDSGGTIATIAGTGVAGTSPDGTLAAAAQISYVYSMAYDAAGNLYFVASNRVRRINASDSTIWTVAGTGTSGFSGDGGAAVSANLNNPQGIAIDSGGNIYIADTSNQRVRKVNASDGKINTVAGTGSSGFSGDTGPATSARLNSPRKVAIDAAGYLYIADNGNSRIRMVAPDQTINTVSTFSGRAVAVGGGSLFVASNNGIQQIAPDGTPATIAGGQFGFYGENVPALMAAMNIVNLAVSPSGIIYAADDSDNAVRKLAPVSPGTAALSVSPSGINVRIGNLSSSTFTETLVLNGSGTFTWTAATNVNAPAGSQWLSINPTIGTSQGAPISVLVNAAGLPPGFYTGFVTIGSGNAVNISVVVPVTLTVLESILSSNPSSLSVTATAGGASPGNRTIPVTNGGSGAAFGFAAAAIVDTPQGGSWLSVSPGAGTTGSTTLTASYDISALGSGIYTGRIVIASAQAANSPYIIPVTLTVNPSAAPALALISPSSASPGQAVTVALTGTNFSPIGNTINISGTGVTAGAVNFMGGTSLITTFTIDAAAVPGDRNVTVTTANGTSEIRSFTVTSKKGRGQLISP